MQLVQVGKCLNDNNWLHVFFNALIAIDFDIYSCDFGNKKNYITCTF